VDVEGRGAGEDLLGERADGAGELGGLGVEGEDLGEEERFPERDVAEVAGEEEEGEVVERHGDEAASCTD